VNLPLRPLPPVAYVTWPFCSAKFQLISVLLLGVTWPCNAGRGAIERMNDIAIPLKRQDLFSIRKFFNYNEGLCLKGMEWPDRTYLKMTPEESGVIL
jgi:hypothetical protein